MKKTLMLAVALLAPIAALQAQGSPAAVVEARQANFKKIGGGMRTMTQFVRNDQGSAADVQAAARTIAQLAPQVPTWFPAGTAVGVGKSAALPSIWTKTAEFRTAAANFNTQAQRMVAVAATGDKAAIGPQLAALGGTCKACHDQFKAED